MKINNKDMGINLQLFAEGGEPEEVETEESETVTLTQEELEKKLQSEADKRVTKALETAKSKWQQEYKEQIEKERQEAKRLAQLSAEEREREIAAQTAKELEETKAQLRRFQLEQDTISRLSEEGLDISFKDFLIGQDEAATNENIKNFKGAFDAAVRAAVEDKLKGPTPKVGDSPIRSTKKTDLSKLAEEARII